MIDCDKKVVDAVEQNKILQPKEIDNIISYAHGNRSFSVVKTRVFLSI